MNCDNCGLEVVVRPVSGQGVICYDCTHAAIVHGRCYVAGSHLESLAVDALWNGRESEFVEEFEGHPDMIGF